VVFSFGLSGIYLLKSIEYLEIKDL
jgi:hypothetical protein